MRIAMLGGLAALVLASTAPDARADIGPISPARKACSGLQEGAACKLDGKAGTCHGPHASRITCDLERPPSQGSSAATEPVNAAPEPVNAAPEPVNAAVGSGNAPASAGTGSAVGSAQPADSAAAEPAATPGHKRGCAATPPGSAALVGLAIAALALVRRRRSRSMS